MESRPSGARAALRRLRPPRAAIAGLRTGLPLAGLAAAALLVLALYLSDYFVREARTARSAESALAATERAADINPWSVTPHYLAAATLEDEGDVEAARSSLEHALELEPRNFATVALIGDLAMRNGEDGAMDWYLRAAALNPRDVGLEELAEKASRKAGQADATGGVLGPGEPRPG
jgi:tetratricopeptide (TPR) repeat protein